MAGTKEQPGFCEGGWLYPLAVHVLFLCEFITAPWLLVLKAAFQVCFMYFVTVFPVYSLEQQFSTYGVISDIPQSVIYNS